MTLDDLRRLRGVPTDGDVLLSFAGEFTSGAVASLAGSVRRRLDQLEVAAPVRRRLLSTFVEMAQNVGHYGAAPRQGGAEGPRRGVVGLGVGGGGFWVACANLVPAERVARIAGRLDALRDLSPSALHEVYRAQLADDDHERRDPLSRGAGLGFLTMARAASAPLEYDFEPEGSPDGGLARFSLCARLTTPDAPRSTP